MRYEKSKRFRRLLRQLDLFWGIPAFVIGVALLVAIGHHGVQQELAYGLGWGVPPLWAAIWAGITTVWVKIALRREHREWTRDWEASEKEAAIAANVVGVEKVTAIGDEVPERKQERNGIQ